MALALGGQVVYREPGVQVLLPSDPCSLVVALVPCVDCRAGHMGASAVAVADAVAHCTVGSNSCWAVVDVDKDLRSLRLSDRD